MCQPERLTYFSLQYEESITNDDDFSTVLEITIIANKAVYGSLIYLILTLNDGCIKIVQCDYRNHHMEVILESYYLH